MVRNCTLCGQSKAENPNVVFFPVPKDEKERRKWVEVAGKHLSVYGFVCSIHFPSWCLGSKKLLKGALPSVTCCQTNGLCVVPYAIQLLFVQFPEGYFMFSGVIFMKNFTSRLALEGLPLLDFRQYQSADSDNTFLGIFLASRNENPHTIYQLASFDKVNLKAVIEGDIPILTSGFMPGHARKKHMQ